VILVGLQVAAALAYAHEVGVIHRDIKPSNLMLMRHPSGDIFVKVIDFGIAKLLQDSELAAPENAPAGARRKTRDVDILGTAPFWCGEEGPTADVYALALTLAVLLTGKIPNAGAPVDLSDPAIPAKLTSVLQTALALDGKITTMNALDAALREASDILDPKAAEADRRRYFAEMFPRAKPPAAAVGDAAPAPRAPRFADRYILCDELGQGGMGLVRTAFDPEFRRRVALKTMLPQYAGRQRLQARFRREARALAAIDHPGVPRVYEIGSKPEPYFTMEIVEGLRLESETRIEPVRALSLAIDLAELLAVAHDAGVIHRDVKPANIMIGKGDRVRLLDFGMCLLLPRYHQRELLFPPTPPIERYETGEHERVIGTPGYTAPEVIAGEGTSVRSDIYSVCAVLYRMLRGQPLVDPSTSTSRPIRRGEFTGPLVPVADLLRRGTARDPSDRPRNMADLLAELEAIRSALRRASRRQTLVRVAVLTALTSIIAALSAAWMFATPPTEPRDARVPAPAIVAVSPESPKPDPLPNTPTSPSKELAAGNKETEEAKPAKDEKAPHPHGASPSPAPPVLTEDIVASRLKKQRDVFETCQARYHLLRVEIAAGRVTLLDVNGMPFSPAVPEHTCLADGLRQIRFPRVSPAAGFVVPLDLRPPPERPR